MNFENVIGVRFFEPHVTLHFRLYNIAQAYSCDHKLDEIRTGNETCI